MPFVRIKYIIPQAAKNHQAEPQFIKYKVIGAWEQVAPGFFSEAAALTKAVDFQKGTLTVACLDKDLSFGLRALSPQLVRALNECLGRERVFSLAVEI